MTSPSINKKYFPIILAALLAAGATACSSGDGAQMAEPNFCPTNLAQALAGNEIPRAYYQERTTERDVDLDITLFACDPDTGSSSGLSWAIVSGPFNGTASTMGGQYPDAVITYTPSPGYLGSDFFYFQVYDGEDFGNVAQVEIGVVPPTVTTPALLLGGSDIASGYGLWAKNDPGSLFTIAGSAQFFSAQGISDVRDPVLFGSSVFWVANDGGFLVAYDLSDGSLAAITGFPLTSTAPPVVHNGSLYTGARQAPAVTSYLWAVNGSGSWTSIPGTANQLPRPLASFNNKLYYGADDLGYQQLWSYNGSTVVEEVSSTMGVYPSDPAVLGGSMYFTGDDDPAGLGFLWEDSGSGSAGTIAGTSLLYAWKKTVFNNRLYFSNGGISPQLYRYNPSGSLLTALSSVTATGGMSPGGITPMSGLLYMAGQDDSGLSWLWSMNTSEVLSTVTGTQGKGFFNEAAPLNSTLYFPAPAGSGQPELYSYSQGAGLIRESASFTGLDPGGLIVVP
jgi:hypothetical protein